MNDAGLVIIDGVMGSIIYEISCTPRSFQLAMRRACQGNRAALAENPGLIAFRLIRFSKNPNGWILPSDDPPVPYRFRYDIYIEDKIPMIQITEFPHALNHSDGKLRAKEPLFGWIGYEKNQNSLREGQLTRSQTILRRRRERAQMLEMQRLSDEAVASGKKIYTPKEEATRRAVLEDREKDARKKRSIESIKADGLEKQEQINKRLGFGPTRLRIDFSGIDDYHDEQQDDD